MKWYAISYKSLVGHDCKIIYISWIISTKLNIHCNYIFIGCSVWLIGYAEETIQLLRQLDVSIIADDLTLTGPYELA